MMGVFCVDNFVSKKCPANLPIIAIGPQEKSRLGKNIFYYSIDL
jgi:hypothetical protein